MRPVKEYNREEMVEYIRLLEEIERRESMKTYQGFAEKNLWLADKAGKRVRFEYNIVQRSIAAKVEELRSKGIPPRILVLKARQMGCSVGIDSMGVKDTATNQNKALLVVAHRDDSTKSLFERTKSMVDSLPEELQPLQRKSNAKEVVFDRPPNYRGHKTALHSKIQIQTAGSESIGRSEPHHYAHLSEYGFWKGDAKKQLGGIMASVPATPDTWVVIESTANGMNHFYDLWVDAVAGEESADGEGSMTQWFPMFFPWHAFPEYQIGFNNEMEKVAFFKRLTPYEHKLINDFGLTLAQIHWWDYTWRVSCGSDLNMMRQENPSTAEEAFIMSGTPVFDLELVRNRIQELTAVYAKKPPRKGLMWVKYHNEMVRDEITESGFRTRKTGDWTLYEQPKSGRPYTIGGDTAGDGSDWFSIEVTDAITQRTVAFWTGKTPDHKYAEQVYAAGMYYNHALVAVEINFNTFPVIELQRLGYHYQFTRKTLDEKTEKWTKKVGWKTGLTGGVNTRPLIISNMVELLENRPDVFTDLTVLRQMMTFMYDDNRRPDHLPGKHDDGLFGSMIAKYANKQQTKLIRIDDDDTTEYVTEVERKDAMERKHQPTGRVRSISGPVKAGKRNK